jgi:hypothetical protein
MLAMAADEWRVEVDLDDEAHGISLGERMRSLELDEEARKELGENVIITRDGPRFYLYAETEARARAAERVVLDLLDEHELTADIAVTRWHPVEEAWEDAAVPLPQTETELEAERASMLVGHAVVGLGEAGARALLSDPDAWTPEVLGRMLGRLAAGGQTAL